MVIDGEPTLTTEGTVGAYPSQDPDDRRRHRRRRRRLDRLALARGHAQGRPAVGGRRPRPALLRQGRHRADHHRRPRRARPDPAPPARRRDPARRRRRPAPGVERRSPSELGLDLEACATGVLEISAWNQANALRQVTVKRGLDVRDFTLATFGGSGSLLLCRLMDILGLPTVLVPPNPGNVSAFGLLTVDVKNDYVQTARRAGTTALDAADGADGASTRSARRPRAALAKEGFADGRAPVRAHRRPALLRAGLRGAGADVPDGRRRRGRRSTRSPTRSTPSTGRSTATTSAATPRQQVEWVNLRVSGHRPDPPAARSRARRRAATAPPAARPGPGRSASTPPTATSTTPVLLARRPGAGDVVEGPAIIEEFGSTVPLHPGLHRPRRRLRQPRRRRRSRDEPAARPPTSRSAAHRRRRRERRPGAGRDRPGLRWPASRWRSRPRSRAPPQSR